MTDIGFTPVAPVTDGPYTEIKIDGLEGGGMGPIGMRVGGFGQGALGGAFEFSFSKHLIETQTADGSRDGLKTKFSLPAGKDYLDMTSLGFSGDLFIRHAGKVVDPYFGIGLGLSLNTVKMPYVKGYTESSAFARPINEFALGLMFNLPVGVRIKIDPRTHVVAELRYEFNSVSFERDIKNESDKINSQGVRFLLGMGFGF
jgi:hypothetical protein